MVLSLSQTYLIRRVRFGQETWEYSYSLSSLEVACMRREQMKSILEDRFSERLQIADELQLARTAADIGNQRTIPLISWFIKNHEKGKSPQKVSKVTSNGMHVIIQTY